MLEVMLLMEEKVIKSESKKVTFKTIKMIERLSKIKIKRFQIRRVSNHLKIH